MPPSALTRVVPGRSDAHTRVVPATVAYTVGRPPRGLSQASAAMPPPEIRITVGEPVPVHWRYIFRPPPTSNMPAMSCWLVVALGAAVVAGERVAEVLVDPGAVVLDPDAQAPPTSAMPAASARTGV